MDRSGPHHERILFLSTDNLTSRFRTGSVREHCQLQNDLLPTVCSNPSSRYRSGSKNPKRGLHWRSASIGYNQKILSRLIKRPYKNLTRLFSVRSFSGLFLL